ncbi:MAG: helicase-related protein, partial [Chloroflexota bacterium]
LINHERSLARLFHDLRFVVIDEIHVFMNVDRGRQILCQLDRLTPYLSAPPRRIGLSATLGDYTAAESWLQANTDRPVTTVSAPKSGKVRLSVEYFYRTPPATDGPVMPDVHDQHIFNRTQTRTKSLIFTNSRGGAEQVITNLRNIAQSRRLPDIYHVHHGSVAAPLREAAEKAMKEDGQPAVTAATLTLELGVDIGHLEQVIQLNAPQSVAGFLQRLGRSGRRGDPAEMWFVCSESEPTGEENLAEQFPWDLLQTIAILQLYLEEKWIEPLHFINYPYSLLYHQTMSTLLSLGELPPADLARRVLTLPPFRHITQEDYQQLLRHLMAIDHIERIEDGGLIVGLAGEKVARNYRFYAVFQDNEEITVYAEGGEVGRIMRLLPKGERFALAGRSWEVVESSPGQQSIFVKAVPGQAEGVWLGGGGEIHTRVLQRMQQVLLEPDVYPYLQPGAKARLVQARALAQRVRLDQRQLIQLGHGVIAFVPWRGTRAFHTLIRVVQTKLATPLDLSIVESRAPYYILLRCTAGTTILQYALSRLQNSELTPEDLLDKQEAPEINKYDPFVPPTLRRKGAADFLRIKEDDQLANENNASLPSTSQT